MEDTPLCSAAGGGLLQQRAGALKGWIARLARPALAYTPDYLRARPGCDSDNDSDNDSDDATVCTPTQSTQRQRQRRRRSLSQASDAAEGAAVLDSARVDTAIAAIVRARQQDQLGDHDAAAQLFVAGLERLSLAMRDADRVADPHVRERLAMLRLLVEPVPKHLPAAALDLLPATAPGALSATAPGALSATAPAERPSTVAATPEQQQQQQHPAAAALDLLTQAAVAWLTLVGSVLAWATALVRSSALPEAVAGGLVRAAGWAHRACVRHNVYDHGARLACALGAWLASVDREAAFSQRLACAAATALGALVRFAEAARHAA
ncbi:hypothetical protein H4R18_003055 [Coemansia javaensis]|uniref:Uncharacterized protein n=1 Tax=Coemansia javaensis TaxID=2761396 RepID=A0A9W8HEX6_9FUNG|nr:hypothetical protein H4R18_003055 [Coemansia javaensis]